MKKVSNHEFTKDQDFKDFCEIAEIEPTKRQASKYRNYKGKAFNFLYNQNLSKV